MRKYLLLFLIPLPILSSQISISSSDIPEVDSLYLYQNANFSGVDYNTTGANMIWDYTGLVPTTTSQDSFVDPASTNFVYQLVFNNFLFPANDATHAQLNALFSIPSGFGFTIDNVTNFYKNSSSSFTLLGIGATINSIPTPIPYTTKDKIYQFPLEYNDYDSSDYYFEIDIPTIGFWKQKGIRVNSVDGWGTLNLPNGETHQVLRVKTKLYLTDSLRIDSLGFTLPVNRIQYEYKFLSHDWKQPVLQINTQPLLLTFGPEIITSVRYKYTPLSSSVENENNFSFLIFPNPVSNVILLHDFENIHYEIYSIDGKIIQHGLITNHVIQTQALNAGNYILKIGNNYSKFIKI